MFGPGRKEVKASAIFPLQTPRDRNHPRRTPFFCSIFGWKTEAERLRGVILVLLLESVVAGGGGGGGW